MTAPKTLGIVHTSFVLVELLDTLARQRLPGVHVVNVVDDSLLGYALERGVDESLRRRMKGYLLSAADAGADVILSACSSVGETVDAARADVPVPVLKIDEAMAEKAVSLGRRIGIFATAASTFGPTSRLLLAKAKAAGVSIETSEKFCGGAFDLLLAGKIAEHDRLVTEAVLAAAPGFDVVLFAQASMSRLAPAIAPQLKQPLLTSPELAMQRLAEMLR
jgi:Asp/Glu/hydantoin racemase